MKRVADAFGVPAARINPARAQDCLFVSACRGAEMPESVTRELMLEVDRAEVVRCVFWQMFFIFIVLFCRFAFTSFGHIHLA
jgi:hypothetical protein